MKKFVLVNIPSSENAYHHFREFIAVFPPIGICTIASTLEKNGFEVKIIDGDAENLSLEETIAITVKEAPDYVGSTTMTATMDISGKFYSLLKTAISDVTVIVGGPHVSAIPVETIREYKDIDIVVVGEGDETIIEILEVLEKRNDNVLSQIEGIAFKQDDSIIRTAPRPPIDDLSKTHSPAFHLLNFDLYRSYGWNSWISGYRSPLGVVFTSRGCYGKCNFCASHCVFGPHLRHYPIKRVKDEIDLLVNKYNIKILYFQDDTFTANRKMVNNICDYLIEKGYNKKLEIMISARADTAHGPTYKKMRQAGIRWICFGVESGSQRILDKMNKRMTIDQIKNAFNEANKAGLYIAGNYMLGHIGETWDSAMKTIELSCELKHDYASYAIAIPFPGTGLYQHCLDNEIKLPSWNNFGSVNTPPIPLNDSLDSNSLIKLRSIAINKFFKRASYIINILWKFDLLSVLKDFINMYIAIKKEKKAKRF